MSNFFVSTDEEENIFCDVDVNISDENETDENGESYSYSYDYIEFNFEKPVKLKYTEIEKKIDVELKYSFAIFARNEQHNIWDLIYYKENSGYIYSNFDCTYKHYKWLII